MAVSFRRIGLATVLLGAGALLGPVVFAAIGAAVGTSQKTYPLVSKGAVAFRLVEAYRARLPRGRLFTSVDAPKDGRECGYENAKVFPGAMDQFGVSARTNRFTYYSGYWVLDHWRNDNRNAEWVDGIGQAIAEDMSAFEIDFLRRCIEATAFAPICMKKVAQYGNTVSHFNRPQTPSPLLGYGSEDQIVCTYVDGVAARRGVPLAEAPRE